MAMMDPSVMGMTEMGPPPGVPAGPPPMPGDGGMGMPSEDDIILMLIQEAFGKWGMGEQVIAGEKQALIETLLMLAGGAPPTPQDSFTEGGPMPMGMM